MTPTSRPPAVQVVVAFEFTPTSELALMRALDLAASAPEHVLHVITAIDKRARTILTTESPMAAVGADEVQALIVDRVTALLSGRPAVADVEVFAYARYGQAADCILALAREVGADLVLVGSHGSTGIERVLLGSVSERVVREAQCPVLVTRLKTYVNVERMHVYPYEHDRHAYHPPHRYHSVNNDRVAAVSTSAGSDPVRS